jgi:hypothetical protein
MDANDEERPHDDHNEVSSKESKESIEPAEQPLPAPAEEDVEESVEEVVEPKEPLFQPGEAKEPSPQPVETETTTVEEKATPIEATVPSSSEEKSVDATEKALASLTNLVAVLGLSELAATVEQGGIEALQDVRRSLASQVNVAPRDVRIGRLLRLSLRLLPAGDEDDKQRAHLLSALSDMVPTLKRWTRRRLEARHSGAKGNFLADAVELGVALERIPGLGQHLPLQEDNWPLPSDMVGLTTEVSKLAQSVNLPSAGGVKA